mmetsp:Transcript_123777/g.174482  ORF Transcript_123777/g.174482 Transcript_123777/m.174482 type:complete len:226 (-) Transcript_123777:207-884(-)
MSEAQMPGAMGVAPAPLMTFASLRSAPKRNLSPTAARCSRPWLRSVRIALCRSLSLTDRGTFFAFTFGSSPSFWPDGSFVTLERRRCEPVREDGRILDAPRLFDCGTCSGADGAASSFLFGLGSRFGGCGAGALGVLPRPALAERLPVLCGRGGSAGRPRFASRRVSPSRSQLICFLARSCASFAAGFRQFGGSLGRPKTKLALRSGARGGQDLTSKPTPYSSSS